MPWKPRNTDAHFKWAIFTSNGSIRGISRHRIWFEVEDGLAVIRFCMSLWSLFGGLIALRAAIIACSQLFKAYDGPRRPFEEDFIMIRNGHL